jgi:tetratricopeptide (TPR) repeat protein
VEKSDGRIWTLFTVTLFVPAVLGFLWLLRGVLRPGVLAGRDFTLGQRLLTEPRVLVDYLHWTLFPNPMVLSLYHDEIVVSTGLLTPWTTLGAMVLLAALIVIAVWLRKRRPLVSLGIGWFFAAQLLTATIIPLELVYEQRMYFASIGVLLAAGALLLGLRWRVRLPLLRGFIVAIALLWFAVATNLRAREWSNPLRLAIAEANRHPESPRAVYEAGRLLLIASNYEPGKTLDASWKYLREAAAIPGSSSLSDQAMIMIADHGHQGEDAAYWNSMTRKLRDQPTRQEDISALVSLTNCYGADICKFDVLNLQRAYEAALSRPHPIARLNSAYAAFQRDIMHDDQQAITYLERAVAGAPGESAYRVDLAALYARDGQTEKALQQIDALRRMNLAGRLDGQIATLERLAEKGTGAIKSNRKGDGGN